MREFEEIRETLTHGASGATTLVHRTPAKNTRDYRASLGNKKVWIEQEN